jgi:calcium-binding protein CML
MSVPAASVEIPATKKPNSDSKAGSEKFSTSRSSPIVERFYEKYHSFKAKKAPAVDEAEIKHVFDYFDENHDGLISKDDLGHFLGRLGMKTSEEEITSMLCSVDANGDGSADFNEFASLYKMIANDEFPKDGEEDEDLKDAFHVFDKNDDGFISPDELQEMLVNLGIDEGDSLTNCKKMIDNVDVDGNGVVDFCEFKKMMTSDCPRS